MKSHNKKIFLVCLSMSILFGVFLWIYSDPPPYTYPEQEASMYWTHSVKIAESWRDLYLSLWDPEVGGGSSLYLAGMYPLLTPVNILAWLVSNDHFYMLMIILPYVIGFFLTALILMDIFKIGIPYAFFASFYYLGAGLGRQTAVLEDSFKLWGFAFFPLMIYCFYKLSQKSLYLASAVVGGLIALLLATEGVVQYPQTIIWWCFFLTALFVSNFKAIPLSTNIKQTCISLFLLIFTAFTLYAIQLIPSYLYTFKESIRTAGHYPIGSFPLIRFDGLRDHLAHYLYRSFFSESLGVSMKGVFALILTATALFIANPKETLNKLPNKSFLKQIWLACLLYMAVPHLLEWITKIAPAFLKLFSILSKFTLAYAIHMIDFSIALTLGIIVSNENTDIFKSRASSFRRITSLVLVVMALIFASLPFLMTLPFFEKMLLAYNPLLNYMNPERKIYSSLIVLISTYIFIIKFVLRPKGKLFHIIFILTFPFLGFMTTITSYNWNDKGRRSHFDKYMFSTPEYQYYSSAKGKYYLPVEAPPSMEDDYNLLHGVHGTMRLTPLPAKRFVLFLAHYRNDIYKRHDFRSIYKFRVSNPSEAITTYFPVDFTTIKKDKKLGWSNFQKAVSGEKYDVWTRKNEPSEVLFAHHVRVTDFEQIIKNFDTPFKDTIYVDKNDASKFKVQDQSLEKASKTPPVYSFFDHKKGDTILFQIDTPYETYVMVPQSFAPGWKVKIDNIEEDVFPANYLFIGFKAPAGKHSVVLKYAPPGFVLGSALSIIGATFLILLILRVYRVRKT